MESAPLPSSLAGTWSRRSLGASRLLPWAITVAVASVILAPIAMVTLNGFNVAGPFDPFRFGLTQWAEAWANPRVAAALWNTVFFVAMRVLLGFAIAVPAAWLVARTDIPGARWLEFGFWIAFFMPSLAYVQGWTLLLEARKGLLNQWLFQHLPFMDAATLDIYSYWGIVLVHVMAQNVSALFILLVLGFRNMDSSLEEAARIAGATRWMTLRQILMPLSRPMLAMLMILAIIRGMQSYEIEAVLGAPANIEVYSTLVVSMIGDDPPRLGQAAALSSLVLLLLVPLIVFQRFYVGRRRYATVSSKMRTALVELGGWRWPAFGLVLALVLLQILVPSLATVAGSFMKRWGYFAIEHPWTLMWWKTVLGNEEFLSALGNTVLLGVLAGAGSAAISLVVAWIVARSTFAGRGTLEFVSWLPWAVPGVLLSLGVLTVVLSVPPLRVLHGSMVVLVAAMVLFRFPLGVHLLKSGLLQINRELEEASTVCGASALSTQIRIIVPIVMPMLVSVALMAFVSAVTEISGVVMLASTDTRTLSLLSLDYLVGRQSHPEAAAVVTTVMVFLCIGITLGARAFGLRLADEHRGGAAEGAA